MSLQANTFAEYLPALLAAGSGPLSAADFDAVMSAYGLHARRFVDLDAPLAQLAQQAAGAYPVATRLLVGMGVPMEPLLWHANPEIAAWLLANGADPNAEIDGDTPLIHAARADLPALTRALLAAGARPNTQALDAALDADHPAVALLLIQAGLPADPEDIAARCPDLHLRLSGEEPGPDDLPTLRRWMRSGPPSVALGDALMHLADHSDDSLKQVQGALSDWARVDTPHLVAHALALARGERPGTNERPGWRAFDAALDSLADGAPNLLPFVPELAALLPLLWAREQKLALHFWIMSLVSAQPDHPDAMEYGLRAAELWGASLPSDILPQPAFGPRLLALLQRQVDGIEEADYADPYNARLWEIRAITEMLDNIRVPYEVPERALEHVRSL